MIEENKYKLLSRERIEISENIQIDILCFDKFRSAICSEFIIKDFLRFLIFNVYWRESSTQKFQCIACIDGNNAEIILNNLKLDSRINKSELDLVTEYYNWILSEDAVETLRKYLPFI